MKLSLLPLLLLVSLTSMAAFAVDTDGDGMEDSWETSMGLNPNDGADAFADKDGDRVPNLWEFARGTAANNGTSLPAYDATVDSSLPSAPLSQRYATLQEAYDNLSTDPNYRSLVFIKRGNLPASLSGSAAPKKVAWIGEQVPDRASGYEGVVLDPSLVTWNNAQGILLSDDTVLDSIIMGGILSHYTDVPAVVVKPDASVAANVPEVRLINCIVRNWTTDNPGGSGAPFGAVDYGALLNLGGEVWLVHCTFWQSAAYNAVPAQYAVASNQTGVLKLLNSILWDDRLIYPTPAVTGIAPLVTDCVRNPGTSPFLTNGGYIENNSYGCKNIGDAFGVTKDIHGETRPTAANTLDIGADEWINVDSTSGDTLPDWWEKFWFGSTSPISTTSYNSITYFNHVHEGSRPTGDQDGDGLMDNWEIIFFSTISAQGAAGNPDNDGRTNIQEQADGTDPTIMAANWDGDGDGLMDVWEIQWFTNTTAQNGTGNPDSDGRNNLQEQAAGTNPTTMDADWDGDGDGLMDVWEISFFGNITAQTGSDDTDASGGPDGATNLEEQARGSNPTVYDEDWDGDGWNDLWEKTTFGMLTQTPATDFDGDGLSNGFEMTVLLTDALVADSNSDGVSDGLAWSQGLNVSGSDADSDGLSDTWEMEHGTNPYLSDTDRDGLPDVADFLPLDPTAGSEASLTTIPGSAPSFTLISPVYESPEF